MPAPPGGGGVGLSPPDTDPSAGALPGPALAAAAARRSAEVVAALAPLSDEQLRAPSLLPGWSRLTIACHLRFGARTLRAMTADARAGRAASYYPGGRDRQRPATLEPEPNESPRAVVASLSEAAVALDELWAAVDPAEWAVILHEPPDNPDLGTVALAHLPLSRLTEVEVHGLDLDVGLGDYGAPFVATALPYRIWRLRARVPAAGVPDATWVLATTDGARYAVTVRGSAVETAAGAAADAADGPGAARIEGSARDLLALLLGRPALRPVSFDGDAPLAASFSSVFPGP